MPTTYATTSTMIAMYGVKLYQALNVTPGSTISANAQLLDAIDSANSTVDSFIRSRYDPDVVASSQVLIDAANAIAFWLYVVSNRPEMATDGGVAWNNGRTAEKTLRDIQKGSAAGGIDLDFPATNRTQHLENIDVVVVGSGVAATDPMSWPRRIDYWNRSF